MKTAYLTLVVCGFMLMVSCEKSSTTLTEEQKNQIADSVKSIIQQNVALWNALDFKTSISNYFSSDPDAHYIENGHLYSYKEIDASYTELASALDLVENKIDNFDIIVLSKDAAFITAPIHLKMKAKGLPEFNTTSIWTALLQKRKGKWMIIRTHESQPNYAELAAALTAPQKDEKEK